MPTRPFHIVIEGIDGCGKGTQIRLLHDFLLKHGRKPWIVQDPGGNGTGAAAHIRKILLDKTVPMTPHQQLLLYTAARIDARDATVKYRSTGHDVIGDRYVMSTYVYQGLVYNSGINLVESLHKTFVGLNPDCTILLDLPAHIAWGRANAASAKKLKEGDPGSDMDRHESQGIVFAENLRKGYRLIGEDDPNCWIVDAEQSPEAVFKEVLEGCKLRVPGFAEFMDTINDEHVSLPSAE